MDDIYSSNTAHASFHPTKIGVYIINLRVEDNDAAQDEASVTINVSTAGTIAVATTNAEQYKVGAVVNLNGTESSDVEGNPLNYLWQFIHTPVLCVNEIDDPTEANASFTIYEPGVYEIELIVTAGSNTARDTVVFSVFPPEIFLTTSSGEIGDEVNIYGDNFSSNNAGNIVKFNSFPAVVDDITIGATSIILTTVPVGATTGYITVEVVETGEMAISPSTFNVTAYNDGTVEKSTVLQLVVEIP